MIFRNEKTATNSLSSEKEKKERKNTMTHIRLLQVFQNQTVEIRKQNCAFVETAVEDIRKQQLTTYLHTCKRFQNDTATKFDL